MNGQLAGIFKRTLQIGGLKEWNADIKIGANKLVNWKLSARGYWLFDYPTPSDKLTVRLYHLNGYWEGVCRIELMPLKLLNTLIHSPIELFGSGVLESKQ